MDVTESAKIYLKTIFLLRKKFGYVRYIDIAKALTISQTSVSRAIRRLKENGYVDNDPHGMILLTDEGRKVAEDISERHEILTKHFMQLGVSEDAAAQDASRFEHIIGNETFEMIKKQLDESKNE